MISEFENFLPLTGNLVFKEDYVFLRSEGNLTRLENDFKFIKRVVPDFPKNVFLSDHDLSNNLIRVAVTQRKDHIFSLANIFKLYHRIS